MHYFEKNDPNNNEKGTRKADLSKYQPFDLLEPLAKVLEGCHFSILYSIMDNRVQDCMDAVEAYYHRFQFEELGLSMFNEKYCDLVVDKLVTSMKPKKIELQMVFNGRSKDFLLKVAEVAVDICIEELCRLEDDWAEVILGVLNKKCCILNIKNKYGVEKAKVELIIQELVKLNKKIELRVGVEENDLLEVCEQIGQFNVDISKGWLSMNHIEL
ncbi:hypothetical protein PFISCL1PPCAC_939 [Pristionchus fissidentatus]|uniref:Uncharacterized protein n=1 Tax=Pristionchus fissidentatus TaxID=1538716 RepID=A0AAV5UTP3_9BILA|nr:hypothetical protein PFISCL1PPCAC_939 [Pristionchus fissidentatus]